MFIHSNDILIYTSKIHDRELIALWRIGTARTLGTWIGDKAKSAWDNLSNLKAKERREQEQNKSKEEKHGTSDWEDHESEDYVEWQKKQAIKKGGKDAGRRGHDAKPKGAPDRSKREIDDDYDQW